MSINSALRTDCGHMVKVDIHLRNSPFQGSAQTYVQSFATGETIEGIVSILPQDDLAFDKLHISFTGEQSTSIPSSTPSKATHQFLHLIQPLPESSLPNPKIFARRTKYDIPFSFPVTDYLPATACPHSSHPLVKAAHLHPPPSLGDATIAGFGGRLRDDLAPEDGCKIVYTIIARLERPNPTSGIQETIMERRVKVRIKPHVGETPLPDLDLGSALEGEYSLFQDGVVRNSSTKKGGGRLAVTLEKPKCFWHPLGDTVRLISKAVRLTLVYTPSASSAGGPAQAGSSPATTPALPEIKSLRAQITATTLYTTQINAPLHPPQKRRDFFGRPINYRDAEIPLSLPSLPQLRWTRVQGNQDHGQNSSPNPGSEHGPNSPSPPPVPQPATETGVVSYVATVLVPVTLTKDKSFVPTFHSCLISRIYSLSFQLDVKGASTSFKLRVPMTIVAERDPAALPSYNASLGVIETD
ncbi:hypothetical protein BJX68DRAFT_241287 [Aspergillus pseudodeflectus]|uniref:Bul1 C-terminal domain-containing protein n=1 Tax=Aspergillus pseudodeflectus TaxID=176178 RepID=A0ABR4K1M0_9EURO